MRVLAVGLLCAGIGGWSGLQQPASPQQPVFRGGVELITLDVTVVDKDGKPVTGLKADDFAVTLEGQRRAVRALDYREFGASGGAEAGEAAHETSNRAPPSGHASRGGRVVVLLIDDLSSKPGQAKLLLVAAERLLATLDVDDLVGLATTSGLGTALSPTRDRAALLAALKSKTIVGRYDDSPVGFYIGMDEAIWIDRLGPGKRDSWFMTALIRECGSDDDSTLCAVQLFAAARHLAENTLHRVAMQVDAYRDVIRALHSAPEPRVIIALSSGVALSGLQDLSEQFDVISRTAAEAGVQFYALTEVIDGFDMTDVGAGGPQPRASRLSARREEGTFLTSGVQTVAHAAGGEAFLVVGQPDRFFKRIMSETSGVYVLGVEMPAVPDKRRFLNVKVAVARPGVTVRSNPHALVPSANANATSVDEALKTRIAQGGVAFGVPIALGSALRRDPAPGGELQLAVNVQMPASVAAPLSAMYALVNDAGAVIHAGHQTMPQTPAGEDYRIAFPIPLTVGDYRLRFAVADSNGNIGSVEHRVAARLPHFGRLSAGDIFTTWTGAGDAPRFLALETLPEAATGLRASLEIYPDDASVSAAFLTVRFAIVRSGESAPLFEQEAAATRDGAAALATAALPVSGLTAGTYTIRATIFDSGVAAGTVTTLVRKAG